MGSMLCRRRGYTYSDGPILLLFFVQDHSVYTLHMLNAHIDYTIRMHQYTIINYLRVYEAYY